MRKWCEYVLQQKVFEHSKSRSEVYGNGIMSESRVRRIEFRNHHTNVMTRAAVVGRLATE